MTALQHSGASLWRYALAGPLGARRNWMVGGIIGALVAGISLVAAFQLHPDSSSWIAELIPPLFAAFAAAYLAAEHERSGFAALLHPRRQSRSAVLAGRLLTSAVFGLAAGPIAVFAAVMYSPPTGILGALLASLPGVFFLATLASLAASYFRSWEIGLAIALVPWLASVVWGFGLNPLFSLASLRALEDRDPFQWLWLLNRAALIGLGGVLWLLHGWLRPDSLRSRLPGSPLRVATVVVNLVGAYWLTGVLSVLGFGVPMTAFNLGLLPTEFGNRLERFQPLPVNRLLGPAFTVFVGDGLSKQAPDFHGTRVSQLMYGLERWPNSMWAGGMARELQVELAAWYPATGLLRPFVQSERPDARSLSRAQLARLLDPAFPGPSQHQRMSIALHLVGEFSHSEEAKVAGRFLVEQELPAMSEDTAREIGHAALRIVSAEDRPLWLGFLARAGSRSVGPEGVLSYAKRARTEAATVLRAARAGRLSLNAGQMEQLTTLQESMAEILRSGGDHAHYEYHFHNHTH